ncbi:hypothetical protein [Metasolibacillus sp.]|uniref:hypothetical protein n=1 Tax=Metasolibacillus sp. TaxID=2703680 RepID=UPI0025F3A99D|nr:hypothetical protein [Metasolibacillus sp.]MCT6923241.1 hypothetical protein [Metasolibacillus sp.]MCT6939454.1 hypothetical protein [Metasolibacillus sp.]
MYIRYQDLIFPFVETNLERIVDEGYFKINLRDKPQEVHVHLNNELMLLEFSKSLKATCSYLRDFKKEPYIMVAIDLEVFVDEFNKRYKLDAVVSQP